VRDQNHHLRAPLIRFPPGRIIGPLADDHDLDAMYGRESAFREYQIRVETVTEEEEEDRMMAGVVEYPVRSFEIKRRGYIC
jgi:hypothetical protein